MNNQILKTENLIIRKADLSDADFFLNLLNDPGYIRAIRDTGIKTKEVAAQYIKDYYIKCYEKDGYGFYVVALNDGTPIGINGFIKRGPNQNDLGFAILDKYAQNGYIKESTTALIDYAKNQLKFPNISGMTTTDNPKTIHILLKLGFEFQEKIRSKSGKEYSKFILKFS